MKRSFSAIYKEKAYGFYYTLRDWLVPGLNNSQYEYREIIEANISKETKWLDLGCGHEFFPSWMADAESTGKKLVKKSSMVVGIDCDKPSVENNTFIQHCLVGDGGGLPFKANSFNLLTANMVFEHVEFPDQVLQEIYRVLEPGGVFIFHTPNYLNYMTVIASLLPNGLKLKLIHLLEGREDFDIFPTFYRFNTQKAVSGYAENNGFTIQQLILTKTSAETIMLGPLVVVELFLTKLCEWEKLKNFRSIIIGVLRKP